MITFGHFFGTFYTASVKNYHKIVHMSFLAASQTDSKSKCAIALASYHVTVHNELQIRAIIKSVKTHFNSRYTSVPTASCTLGTCKALQFKEVLDFFPEV